MGEQRSRERGRDNGSRALRWAAYGLAVIVVIMLILMQGSRIYTMLTPNVSPDAELSALERANDAVSAVEMVLSFLEGASVLIGLGFGAAALYGIRNT
ncbi:MAG: hypothetical protein JXN59_11045, partial [Anaerolineae bacterium]|nr:hypothetical protein [Anaerolineae bacterium]